MNTETLKEQLERIPLGLVLLLIAGYFGYDYYSFTTSPDSPLIQAQATQESLKSESEMLRDKIKKANEFYKTLDAKTAELRGLAKTLDELKGSLSTEIDVGGFVKMVVTEAQRVGLTVVGMKPGSGKAKEYYYEQPFELTFRGAYVQLLVFLDRLSNVRDIVRVEKFDIKPVSESGRAKYVELQGVVELTTYKYLGTRADEIGRSQAAPIAAPAAASAPPAHQGGGK